MLEEIAKAVHELRLKGSLALVKIQEVEKKLLDLNIEYTSHFPAIRISFGTTQINGKNQFAYYDGRDNWHPIVDAPDRLKITIAKELDAYLAELLHYFQCQLSEEMR